MTTEEKLEALKKIFWDYNTQMLPLDKIVAGDLKSIDEYERALLLNRMLERLSWYDLLDILSLKTLKEYLTKETISRIRFIELRNKYEYLRSVLSGEPLSFTGWGDAYYSRIKHTLFSNRWYSTKQTLL
ncbi:MAG: hypothetical protein KKD86_15210 [Bacteroidetes bacterium]|nr:hypothetical protein [Bacteroidota bacterium]MBU1680172.1 hypothetical protein [Bacteroidota bacterium]